MSAQVSHVIYSIPYWQLQIELKVKTPLEAMTNLLHPKQFPNWDFIFVKKEFFLLLFFFFYLLQAWCDNLGYGDGWMRSKRKSENEIKRICI